MFDWLKPVLDSYDLKARLRPALLCGVPLVTFGVLLIPQFGFILGSIFSIFVYSGGSILLIQFCRDLGKRQEKRLFQLWDGKPSVSMLRHADNRLDKQTKDRYRTFLSETVNGLALANIEEERKNPKKADVGYESATRWLLEQTGDSARFELLFKENVNYGFRRNMLGLKPIALGMDALALLLVVVVAVNSWMGQLGTTIYSVAPELWASLAVTVVHVAILIKLVRDKWVFVSAELYARQLLAVCDILGGPWNKKQRLYSSAI